MADLDAEEQFPVTAASVPRARRWVVATLSLLGRPAEDVSIIVSELVTNCVLHSGQTESDLLTVHAQRSADGIRVEVTDTGGRFRSPSPAAAGRNGGRGLKLVNAMSTTCGVRTNGRTSCWFTYTLAA